MEASPKWSLLPVWLIIGAVAAVEAIARFALSIDFRNVLLIETVAFVIAAAFLNSMARRRQGLTRRAHTSLNVLSVAFVLGAVRSGLWMAGLEVQSANLIILLVGLTLFTLWWRRRKKTV